MMYGCNPFVRRLVAIAVTIFRMLSIIGLKEGLNIELFGIGLAFIRADFCISLATSSNFGRVTL